MWVTTSLTEGPVIDFDARDSERFEAFVASPSETMDRFATALPVRRRNGETISVDASSVVGSHWGSLHADVERFEIDRRSAVEATGEWRGEVTVSRPDGSEIPVQVSMTGLGSAEFVYRFSEAGGAIRLVWVAGTVAGSRPGSSYRPTTALSANSAFDLRSRIRR
ncbi:hypothetical protein JCM18237_25500 [Halorubrum luteum]